jgi:hypothetical protein
MKSIILYKIYSASMTFIASARTMQEVSNILADQHLEAGEYHIYKV